MKLGKESFTCWTNFWTIYISLANGNFNIVLVGKWSISYLKVASILLWQQPVLSRNQGKSQFPFHDLDDNAFKIVLYEFQYGTISYDADHLETLFFIPILDQHSTLSDPNSDLDPDLNNQNYASLASYCNYETAEDLNGVIGGNKLISFSLFHLNSRSLVKNQDALAHLLANNIGTFNVHELFWMLQCNYNTSV